MKILLLGGTGFIGSSIISQRPDWSWTVHGSHMADLRDRNSLDKLYGDYDVIINAAGFYGGLVFNQKYQSQILQVNLEMTANIWKLVERLKPKKFINIGSACIYPSTATDRIYESQIGDRNYHPSVKYSATAKHIQLDLLKSSDLQWEYLILSNVYGPKEHLSFEKSHFVGSLIQKLQKNKTSVTMLGTGVAVRDFIYVEDTAEIICKYAELAQATCSPTNVGTGTGTSIYTMTEKLVQIVNPDIDINWGNPNDDGVKSKVLNNDKMIKDINYHPATSLEHGLETTWRYFDSV